MKLDIIGGGCFGSFLKELLKDHFEIGTGADCIVLAVPFAAYEEMGERFGDKGKNHLINVCSIQSTSTDILLKYTTSLTSIHPLFGRRTPPDKRNYIITHKSHSTVEREFLERWDKVATMVASMTPEEHDKIMAKTHCAAVISAQQAKIFVERAKDIPDEFIPNSFRLLREFVKTMDDMPPGTMQSILANPYF